MPRAFQKLIEEPRRLYLMTVLLAMTAHVFVLKAAFYMDDDLHILNSPTVDSGQWYLEKFRWLPFMIWSAISHTTGIYGIILHALNFTIHATIACLLIPFGQELMRRCRVLEATTDWRLMAAWAGAMLFACHPLTVEPIHYARCLMINLVTLFVLCSAWTTVRFLEKPTLGRGALVGLFVSLATASKNPGMAHATIAVGILVLVMTDWRVLFARWSELRQRTRWSLALVAAVVGAAMAVPWVKWTLRYLEHPLLWDHAFTQGRVFWEYAQRVVLPLQLSSDHLMPMSVAGQDHGATLALLALGIVVLLTIRAAFLQRWRWLGLLGLLALGQLLIRFGYPVRVLMVEYRLYPAMPWLALMGGIGVVLWMRHMPRAALTSGAAVILAFTALSAQRSHQWTDAQILTANVVEQYPLNLRSQAARLQYAWRAEDHEKVRALMPEVKAALEGVKAWNEVNLTRQHDLPLALKNYDYALIYGAWSGILVDGAEPTLAWLNAEVSELQEKHPDLYANPGTDSSQDILLRTRNTVELTARGALANP